MKLVVDHFHVICLANQALGDVRHRVQHDTLGHRGRKDDPLYRIRRRLLAAHEILAPNGFERVLMWLEHGDPDGEVAIAYPAKEQLREVCDAQIVFNACRWETALLRWAPHGRLVPHHQYEAANLARSRRASIGFNVLTQ